MSDPGNYDGTDWEQDGFDAAERARIDGAPLRIDDEHLLFSLLDEHMNANGIVPQIAGYDAHGHPFFAWLDEEGGDCVGLRVVRLLEGDGGTSSTPTETESPRQGETTSLVYPVRILEKSIS